MPEMRCSVCLAPAVFDERAFSRLVCSRVPLKAHLSCCIASHSFLRILLPRHPSGYVLSCSVQLVALVLHLASTAHLTAVTTNQFVYVPTYGYIQCWLLHDMAIFISTEAARRDAGFCPRNGSSPTSTTCVSNEPFLHIVRWEIPLVV